MDNRNIYKIAVASSDGIVVNSHFGRAFVFYIYEADEQGETRFVEKREIEPVCQGGEHDDNRLSENIGKLSDCSYVLVSRIGDGAANALEREGIIPMELPGMIEEALNKLFAYREIQKMLH